MTNPGPGSDRTAILVLGMHRSGTSATTRVLALCGAALPSGLAPPTPDNPTGFWESQDLFLLHDELLTALGSSWRDVKRLSTEQLGSSVTSDVRRRLLEILRESFGEAPLIVVKDPRICRLMPLWRTLLAEFGARPVVVLPIRSPLEVARSLEARNGIALHQAFSMWLQHVLLAERFSRDLPRSFVEYSALLDDWRHVVARIESDLALSLPRRGPARDQEIEDFLSPALRHHEVDAGELSAREDLHPCLPDVFQWMCEAAAGRPGDPSVLDEALARLDAEGWGP